MADYSLMSGFYDVIMTSGYYDYGAIAVALAPHLAATGTRPPTVIELGCGTGLVLEHLLEHCPQVQATGLDFTPAMLTQAAERLAGRDVRLVHGDVRHLALDTRFDVAFSYGGVWYFVPDGDGYALISHLRDEAGNRAGLGRVADHLPAGGRLLLGVQAPHHGYERAVGDDLVYEQSIQPIECGFRKWYGLRSATERLMDQTIDYRVYPPAEATELLADAGFDLVAEPDRTALFIELVRR